MKRKIGFFGVLLLVTIQQGSVCFADSGTMIWTNVVLESTRHIEEKPAALVGDAYQYARAGKAKEFLGLFKLIGGVPSEEMRNLFELWKNNTDYLYTIAVVRQIEGGGLPTWAFLIMGSSLWDSSSRILREAQPLVIYAQDQGGWKVTLENIEPSTTAQLIDMARGFQTSPSPMSEDEVNSLSEKRDQESIQQLKEDGVPRSYILGTIEMQESVRQNEILQTWEDWQKKYHAQMLSNMPPFSCIDPAELDYSSPYGAWRSALYARATGRVQSLLEHADKELREYAAKNQGWVLQNSGKNLFDSMTGLWVVPLMQADAKLDGNEYTMFWWRTEDPVRKMNSIVSFQYIVFRKTAEGYVETRDMDDSDFVRPHEFVMSDIDMEVPFSFGIYSKFHENWSKSKFPAWFYTME